MTEREKAASDRLGSALAELRLAETECVAAARAAFVAGKAREDLDSRVPELARDLAPWAVGVLTYMTEEDFPGAAGDMLVALSALLEAHLIALKSPEVMALMEDNPGRHPRAAELLVLRGRLIAREMTRPGGPLCFGASRADEDSGPMKMDA